jgi:hypothetical protein
VRERRPGWRDARTPSADRRWAVSGQPRVRLLGRHRPGERHGLLSDLWWPDEHGSGLTRVRAATVRWYSGPRLAARRSVSSVRLLWSRLSSSWSSTRSSGDSWGPGRQTWSSMISASTESISSIISSRSRGAKYPFTISHQERRGAYVAGRKGVGHAGRVAGG